LNLKKVLVLLVLALLLVNYINYFQQDRNKLFQQINLLEKKIKKEKRLNQTDINITSLAIDRLDYFFDQNTTYSQSMGDMQEMITKASEGVCEVSSIKWAQVSIAVDWYRYLKFDISLICKPSDIVKFANNIKQLDKLIIFKDINIRKISKKQSLLFSAKLIGFKVQNETK